MTWKNAGNGEWEYHEGEIVIWCKEAPQGIVRRMWLRTGQLAVPIPDEGVTFSAALALANDMVKGGYYWCTDCKAVITKETQGGSHFAGYYCKDCWTKFQEKNARRCRICGRPLWDCYC